MLKVTNIKKSLQDVTILDAVSFSVSKGEILCFIGPSGSGKSTILRCIAQLEKVDSGEIIINNQVLVKNDSNGKAVYSDANVCRDILLQVGLVFQNFNLFPHMTVLENITKAPVKVLHKNKEEAELIGIGLLERVGLLNKKDNYPYQLSGGQQQRVAIARALAMNPQILLFDEPTSALDPELSGEILKIIKDLAIESKISMIVVTHEMQFARDVADRVVFMEHGKIIEYGLADELFGATQNTRTKEFLSGFNKVEKMDKQ